MKLFCRIFFLVYLIEFVTSQYFFSLACFSMPIYLCFSFAFLFSRRKETLICPEFLLLIFFFIITFYKQIVLDNIEILSVIYNQFTEKQYTRGMALNMVAFFAFLNGASNDFFSPKIYSRNTVLVQHFVDIHRITYLFIYLSLFVLFILLATGLIPTVNHYSTGSSDFQNTYIVFYTIIFVLVTVLEFLRLSELEVNSFRDLLRNINRIYAAEGILFFLVLLFIGYRSGAMLVCLPLLLCYTALISKIKNKYFLSLFLIGLLMMVIIGFTRSKEGFSTSVTFLDAFRDFGAAFLTQTGMIIHTDAHSPSGLGLGLNTLFSSVPFVGGFIQSTFGSTYSIDEQSAILATHLFQAKDNMSSGLGTSLVGDLYYSGGLLWVITYMYFIGFLFSYCYNKIYRVKEINIYFFVIYLWLFADIVFLLRAEWYSLFRYVGFTCCLLFLIQLIFVRSANSMIK